MTRGVTLLSGGIDSPVAVHELKKAGLEQVALHLSHETFTGPEPTEKSVKVAELLGVPLYVADADEAFMRISQDADHRFYFVLQKRFMLRVAEALAEREDSSFVATGENLGQVSSQTMWNMGTIDRATRLPVIRPLLTMEKDEIVARARELGTFEISTGPEHCDALGPDHPHTKLSVERVLKEEEKLDMQELVEACVERTESHKS